MLKKVTPQMARAYIETVELPTPSGLESAEAKPIDFDVFKTQAAVVGSDVVSFAGGVSIQRRQDIVNSALLAQLVANKKVADRRDLLKWYDAYFDALGNVGWTLQTDGFSAFEEKADGLQAHEAILKVAAVALGAAPTALALVTETISAMKSMDKDNPWITIFDRESTHGTAARFQVSLVEQNTAGEIRMSLLAFALEAKSTLTQVLFFKIRRDHVQLKQCASQVTINDEVFAAVRDKVQQKLAGFASDFVDSLDL